METRSATNATKPERLHRISKDSRSIAQAEQVSLYDLGCWMNLVGCAKREGRTSEHVKQSVRFKVRRACMNGTAKHVPDRYGKLNGAPQHEWIATHKSYPPFFCMFYDFQTQLITRQWNCAKHKTVAWSQVNKVKRKYKCYWNSLSFVSMRFNVACFWCKVWHTRVLLSIWQLRSTIKYFV